MIIGLALLNDILLQFPGERNPFALTMTEEGYLIKQRENHHYRGNMGPGVK